MKAVIIDDEPLARSLVQEYLQEFPGIEVVAECGDGFEGLKAIQQHKPGLVFLDVQMPKVTGFEMLELVDDPPAIIFTTAFDEYALKAFEAGAVDYLLKPFGKERFAKAVQKAVQQTPAANKRVAEAVAQTAAETPAAATRIVVKNGGKIKIIPVQQVLYVEAADDYVKIHTAEGVFLKAKTMAFYEGSLPPSAFVRIHRSYLVNVTEITRIDPHEKDSHNVVLKSGSKLPVSKSGYARLKEVLGL